MLGLFARRSRRQPGPSFTVSKNEVQNDRGGDRADGKCSANGANKAGLGKVEAGEGEPEGGRPDDPP